MRPLQQDDIQDELNSSNPEFRFIHKPTKTIVKTLNKTKAIKLMVNILGFKTERSDVRQARMDEYNPKIN